MQNFNKTNFLVPLFKWKWYIIGVCLIAVVAAYFLSGEQFITPRYKSEAVLYPANLKTRSTESSTEQMLQWLSSRDIKDSIIHKYNLVEHYNIDDSKPKYYKNTLQTYEKWINIEKTRFQAVKIEVLDKNQQMAYDMVKSIMDYYNQNINQEYRKKYKKIAENKRHFMELKNQEVQDVIQKHKKLASKYGLVNYNIQAEEVIKGYLGTIDNLNSQALNMKAIESLKKNLEEKGGRLIYNYQRIYDLIDQYGSLEHSYEGTLQNYRQKLSYYYVVEKPRKPMIEVYPNRIQIMLVTFISVFLTMLLIIFITENREYFSSLSADQDR